jgi:hypothetical protein
MDGKRHYWSNELLELRVNLDRYKSLMKYTKLGLNVYNYSKSGAKSNKTTIDEAVLYIARLSAILELELASYLRDHNPHVRIRVRDIEARDQKELTVRYLDYVKIIEERLFEFPDVYMWPSNFASIDEYELFQSKVSLK